VIDIGLEVFRAFVLAGLTFFLWRAGKNRFENLKKGWHVILAGFLLLLIGSILDITDNFENLNRYVIIGDTGTEAFLEKFVGFLGGFFVIFIGMVKWIPNVQGLSDRIDRRTQELAEGNSKLKKEIKHREMAEVRLRLTEKVFDNAGDAIVVTDAEPLIIDVNPAFIKITGYDKEDVIGANPSIHQSGRHDKVFYKQMWDSILTTGYWEGEIWDRNKGGESYPKWLTISSIKDNNEDVINYIGIFKDISLQKSTEEKLERLAYHDPLTGLPNRAMFQESLNHELAVVKRRQIKSALMFIDLDRFKYVNDTLGHETGDQLLIKVASRLKSCVRDSDTISRLGGDEFTVILSDVDEVPHISYVASRMVELLQEVFLINGKEAYVGASIGISIFPDDSEDLQTLIKNADVAMYRAKDAGRGTYKFFKPSMNVKNERRVLLDSKLRNALMLKEFTVFYQPKVNLETEETVGFEALIRWQHLESGLVSPAEFIPIAEENGLILPIGEWVLKTACKQSKSWQDVGQTAYKVAVNLSAKQFQHTDLRLEDKVAGNHNNKK
jgi:diguanylate cyclase (GGDEF)-like protein/PAS domain S-box-containing protein